MQHGTAIPDAVLRATLADGATVATVVGDEVPFLMGLPESAANGFRSVWETRRDIDIPLLAELDRIPRETARRWAVRAGSLIAFVDEHRATGLQYYLLIAAKVMVLYSTASDKAFVVDVGPRGGPAAANHRLQWTGAAGMIFAVRRSLRRGPGR